MKVLILWKICDDNGILIGTNEHNNSLVILDLFNARKYKNPHLTIMGTSGSGKSYTLQILATRMRRKHVSTYIIAPIKGHEFIRSTRAVGGQFIRLSPGSKHCIKRTKADSFSPHESCEFEVEAPEQEHDISIKEQKPSGAKKKNGNVNEHERKLMSSSTRLQSKPRGRKSLPNDSADLKGKVVIDDRDTERQISLYELAEANQAQPDNNNVLLPEDEPPDLSK